MAAEAVTLLLAGDVMLGRGVDQILPAPGSPVLREPVVRDAREYVTAAEAVAGPIQRPVDFRWPWGDALRIADDAAPDARVVNLETCVTGSDDFAPRKAVHYRMSPGNIGCLTAGRPDVCVLANNHILDFGPAGLAETLRGLADAGLGHAGAGPDLDAARRPATVELARGGRLVVLAAGMPSSGVPPAWAATEDQPGVHLLPDLSEGTAARLADRVRAMRRPGDVVVASLHWGPNWGYRVSDAERRFAHRLVDSGVDVLHGHSSHHPRPIEVYRDRLILYGCGDLIDDYEGITTVHPYRNDLRLLYFPALRPDSGRLVELRMVPMVASGMRLLPAPDADAEWLRSTLTAIGQPVGSAVDRRADGTLTVTRA